MSSRRNGFFNGGLSEYGGGESVALATPSGAPTRQGGGDTNWASVFSTALPTLLNAYQQQQLMRLNIARINAGQPAVSAENFVQRPPSPSGFQGGVPTQRMLLIGGAVVAALIGLRAAKII